MQQKWSLCVKADLFMRFHYRRSMISWGVQYKYKKQVENYNFCRFLKVFFYFNFVPYIFYFRKCDKYAIPLFVILRTYEHDDETKSYIIISQFCVDFCTIFVFLVVYMHSSLQQILPYLLLIV